MNYEKTLKFLVGFIGLYHLVIGAGLMFSAEFQRFAVSMYGASFDWNVRDTYYIRVIGSFVLVLGSLALVASKDPLKNWLFVLCYVEFFVLRDISRHLYSGELYSGFAVTPFINIMTSAVFAIQAIALGLLIWLTRRGKAYNKSLNEIRARVE
jgi:hypothetical protein